MQHNDDLKNILTESENFFQVINVPLEEIKDKIEFQNLYILL